jgi:hypothetical protein
LLNPDEQRNINKESRIAGEEATYVAMDAAKYPPVHINETDNSVQGSDEVEVTENLPSPVRYAG